MGQAEQRRGRQVSLTADHMVEPLAQRPVSRLVVIADTMDEFPRRKMPALGPAFAPFVPRILPPVEPPIAKRLDDLIERSSEIAQVSLTLPRGR